MRAPPKALGDNVVFTGKEKSQTRVWLFFAVLQGAFKQFQNAPVFI